MMDEREAAALYERICRFAITFPGLILNRDSVMDCMGERDIRAFYGNVLYYEVMPTSHAESREAEAAALCATQTLEKD